MSESVVELTMAQALRREAEERLVADRAPASSGWIISAEALGLLYRLASSPATAGDALKLLHELQAYQVELDLQHHQLQANERELEQEVARYRGLFEAAPMGSLILALEGQILEGNPAAAELLGVDPEDLPGRLVDSFLTPDGRPGLVSLLHGLRTGGPRTSLDVQVVGDADGDPRAARLVATRSPGGEAILVGIADAH
jgi:PAS domain S-box-containing protein